MGQAVYRLKLMDIILRSSGRARDICKLPVRCALPGSTAEDLETPDAVSNKEGQARCVLALEAPESLAYIAKVEVGP